MNVQELARRLCPNASPLGLSAFSRADVVLPAFGVNTPLRIAHFLAQAFHETGGLASKNLEENLFYSAEGLARTFRKYFASVEAAQPYAKKPEAIANRVYGGRMGNISTGDGFRYRGRGVFQLTGKDNYRAIQGIIGVNLVDNPDRAASAEYALPCACAFWNMRRLSPLADEDDLRAITYRINGGYNGLADRAAWLVKAKEALGA